MKKIISTLFLILLLASCSDAARTRGVLKDNTKSDVPLSHSDDTLRTSGFEFSKLYIAEVFIPVTIKDKVITLLESHSDTDRDSSFTCSVQAKQGTQFVYSVENFKLNLKNNLSSLDFTKNDGFMEDDLGGVWEM